MKFWVKLLICILGVQLLGNASGLVTFLSLDDWYSQLQRPPGTPPDGAFGPVWFVIYCLIGISLALIWDADNPAGKKKPALSWFTVQMVFNLCWTPAFFGFQQPGWALVIIIGLLVSIGGTIRSFCQINRTAAALLTPYLLWVAYATYLNAGFWLLNQ